MKKSFIMFLVLLFMVSTCGSVWAAALFEDVPMNHWSYGAVTKLREAGVISDYEDNTFEGKKMVTRYEMAIITRRAMAKAEKGDAAAKELINKMAGEYKNELADLGVKTDLGARVKALEDNKAKTIDFTGSNFRIRYDHKAKHGITTSTAKDFNYNFELIARDQFAPDWMAEIRLEGNKDSNGQLCAAADNLSGQFDIEQMFVTGPVGPGKITVGRYKNQPVFGLVTKEFVEGVKYTFGNNLITTFSLGKNDSRYPYGSSSSIANTNVGYNEINTVYGTSIGSLDLKYALDEKTDLMAAYYHTFSDSHPEYSPASIWEFAFARKLSPDVTLRGDFARSNRADNNLAHVFGISYKKADISKVGSYGWYAEYVHNESRATVKTDPDIKDYGYDLTTSSITSLNGQKGYDINYMYVPIKNTRFLVRYLQAQPINYDNSVYAKSDYTSRWWRAQIEFFF